MGPAFPLTTCPSAQVDIMQMCVIELKERPGRPLFHLEHYIEGKYIKYNSNSGFVRDDNVRLTPQVRLHLGRLQGPARLKRGFFLCLRLCTAPPC